MEPSCWEYGDDSLLNAARCSASHDHFVNHKMIMFGPTRIKYPKISSNPACTGCPTTWNLVRLRQYAYQVYFVLSN